MNWYIGVLKKFSDFSGRARRMELWMFVLINFIIAAGLAVIDAIIVAATDKPIGIFGPLYSLAVILPSVAVQVRRLHDIGKSGWWWFISFVPCVGAIVLLVFFFMDSQPGTNEYGPNPKGIA